jgi:hypothetical protein
MSTNLRRHGEPKDLFATFVFAIFIQLPSSFNFLSTLARVDHMHARAVSLQPVVLEMK